MVVGVVDRHHIKTHATTRHAHVIYVRSKTVSFIFIFVFIYFIVILSFFVVVAFAFLLLSSIV